MRCDTGRDFSPANLTCPGQQDLIGQWTLVQASARALLIAHDLIIRKLPLPKAMG
jgi:hypothetical protein